MLVQQLQPVNLALGQAMRRVRHMGALNLLVAVQLATLGTHHDGVDNLEPQVTIFVERT